MISVILAVQRRLGKSKEHEEVEEEEFDTEVRISDFDTDNDGKISPSEMEVHLEHLFVTQEVLKERLSLECAMARVVKKLPLFLGGFICFVMAMYSLAPSSKVSAAQVHLDKHFNLHQESLAEITDFNKLYDFFLDFERKNRRFMPTSPDYWCEDRYTYHSWDHHYMVPKKTCESPRLYALGFHTEASSRWDVVNGLVSEEDAGGHGDDGGGGGHRRLGAAAAGGADGRRLGGGGGGGGGTQEVRACEDDNHELQEEEGDTVTCEGNQSLVCHNDVGVILCPKSCGFCDEFKYSRMAKFDQPQFAIVQPVIHQTRFGSDECHGFAHTFEMQPYNPKLVLFPSLDGKKKEGMRIIDCINRKKHFDGVYSHEVRCPDDPHQAPHAFCHAIEGKNGTYMEATHRVMYHGIPVYPEMISEVEKQVGAMRYLNWLDVMTETVTISTLVYTEGDELFTSLKVVCSIDEAGNMVCQKKVTTFKDLVKAEKTGFIAELALACILSFWGLCIALRDMWKDPHCDFGPQVFELLNRLGLSIFCMTLLISYSQLIPMSVEYEHLMHSILDFSGDGILGIKDFEAILEGYFSVKEIIYAENQWLNKYRVGAYLIIYAQFIQLMVFFAAHPRMGSLSLTIQNCFSGLMHFLGMFSILFLILTWMAHWMFGGLLPDFRTFGEAIATQAKMLFGDFLYAPGAEHLFGSLQAMYWIYAGTFLLVVYFTLLNFFLAIVVEGFMEFVEQGEANVSDQDFVMDFMDTFKTWYIYWKHGWPAKTKILSWLNDRSERGRPSYGKSKFQRNLEKSEGVILGETVERTYLKFHPREMLEVDIFNFSSTLELAAFVLYYYEKSSWVLSKDVSYLEEMKEKRAVEALEKQQKLMESQAKQEALADGEAMSKANSVMPEIKMTANQKMQSKLKEAEAQCVATEDRAVTLETRAMELERMAARAEASYDSMQSRIEAMKSGKDNEGLQIAAIAAEVAEQVTLASTQQVAQLAVQRTLDSIDAEVETHLGSETQAMSSSEEASSGSNGQKLEVANGRAAEAILAQAVEERKAAEEMLRTARNETEEHLTKARLLLEGAVAQVGTGSAMRETSPARIRAAGPQGRGGGAWPARNA